MEGYHRKATYSWRICSELQRGEFSPGHYRTRLWCHFGTCMALLYTEESALRHTGRYSYIKDSAACRGFAAEEMVARLVMLGTVTPSDAPSFLVCTSRRWVRLSRMSCQEPMTRDWETVSHATSSVPPKSFHFKISSLAALLKI